MSKEIAEAVELARLQITTSSSRRALPPALEETRGENADWSLNVTPAHRFGWKRTKQDQKSIRLQALMHNDHTLASEAGLTQQLAAVSTGGNHATR